MEPLVRGVFIFTQTSSQFARSSDCLFILTFFHIVFYLFANNSEILTAYSKSADGSSFNLGLLSGDHRRERYYAGLDNSRRDARFPPVS